jgi:hypothetical protein
MMIGWQGGSQPVSHGRRRSHFSQSVSHPVRQPFSQAGRLPAHHPASTPGGQVRTLHCELVVDSRALKDLPALHHHQHVQRCQIGLGLGGRREGWGTGCLAGLDCTGGPALRQGTASHTAYDMCTHAMSRAAP